MCVSTSYIAHLRYTHVTVGMESYVIVLVMRLYDGELFSGCLAIGGLADSLLRKSHFAPKFKGRIYRIIMKEIWLQVVDTVELVYPLADLMPQDVPFF